ncbi:apolipoprotein N-acyltransferase [soil metagenome]
MFEYSLGAHPTGRSRALAGFLFGLAWLAPGMAWMWKLTIPGYIVASLVFAALHAAAALAAPTGRRRVVGRPIAHALVEAIRMSFPFGGVPLATLGIAQAGGPLLGVARIGGVIAITWITWQLGTSLGVFLDRHPHSGRVPAAAAATVAAALGLIAAVAPDGHPVDGDDLLSVAAVQGGGEQGTRALDVPSELVTERHLEVTASIALDPSLDLVVWPENVVDVFDFSTSDQLAAIADQSARLRVPFAVGITEDVPDRPGRITNAQIVVTPGGDVVSRYDKVRRVPFGEYVPLRGLLEAFGAPVDQVPSDAIAGTTPAVLDLPDGTRVAVVISWEVFFGGRTREGVRAGGQFILNPTNGASYSGTILQTQQVASSRLRAVETGRWVVQVAPTGFSAFVTPAGTVIDRTGVSERAVIRHDIQRRAGRTWYVRLGDRPWIAALLLGVFLSRLRARSAR